MRRILYSLFAACALSAQPPVAPTNETTEPARGDDVSGFNILQSFELGYRWNNTDGDEGMYRSTVNYRPGVRLLSSSLSVQSKDGHGRWFDQILLNTEGLGGDPYQSVILHLDKNRLYRYDFAWRSDAYYNPGLTIANGQHFMDTTRNLQDHDLTIFPQSAVRFFLGYSRDSQSGPALSTIQLFDGNGDEYPLFSNQRIQQNEYRLGGEARLFGFRLNVLHAWEDFKQDGEQFITSTEPGNNPGDLNRLTSFASTMPYHGTSPYWRVALYRDGGKYWALNGRFTYVAGNRGFIQNEAAGGFNNVGAATLLQTNTYGNAQRPAATGNVLFSLFPASMITITNETSVYNIRMSGSSYFEQFTNLSPTVQALFFNFLGIRTISNTTDIQIRPKSWLTVHAGYTYDDRRIASATDGGLLQTGLILTPQIDQTNVLNAFTLGFRLRPSKSLTLSFDGDLGRGNKPIAPISEKDYTALRARADYKLKQFRLSAYARSDYNTNSVSLTSFASHSRQYGADVSWVPASWFAIDAGYSRLHLDTLGGLSYFINNVSIDNTNSYYVSNLHTGTLAAHFTIHKRADLSLGYSHVQDTGDGRATALGSGAYASNPAFLAAQTFPLRFLSPQARLSIRLTDRLRWNAGYQYYGYRQDFSNLQNYLANIGYSSISWSF